jgi:hypothetical protein
MGYLARIRKGEAKGAMDSTIAMIEVICKRRKGHGTILILWRFLPGWRRKSSLGS